MKFLFPFLISCFLFSCDCVQDVKGVVIDSETKEPIDSVVYYKEGRDFKRTTVVNGQFDINEITGPVDCSCMKVVFERNGYITLKTKIDNGDSSVIVMKKIK